MNWLLKVPRNVLGGHSQLVSLKLFRTMQFKPLSDTSNLNSETTLQVKLISYFDATKSMHEPCHRFKVTSMPLKVCMNHATDLRSNWVIICLIVESNLHPMQFKCWVLTTFTEEKVLVVFKDRDLCPFVCSVNISLQYNCRKIWRESVRIAIRTRIRLTYRCMWINYKVTVGNGLGWLNQTIRV